MLKTWQLPGKQMQWDAKISHLADARPPRPWSSYALDRALSSLAALAHQFVELHFTAHLGETESARRVAQRIVSNRRILSVCHWLDQFQLPPRPARGRTRWHRWLFPRGCQRSVTTLTTSRFSVAIRIPLRICTSMRTFWSHW